MSHIPNKTSNHSIINRETTVNIEVKLGKYNNLYDFWKDHYLAANTPEYYMVVQFMSNEDLAGRLAQSADKIAEANNPNADTINKKKTKHKVPTVVVKSDGKVVAVMRVPRGFTLDDTEEWTPDQSWAWSEAVRKEQEDKLNRLSDLTLDVMEAVFAIWMQRKTHPEAFVEISVDNILEYLGRQKKLSGNGRSGGYKKEQREMVVKQLHLLASTWVVAEGTTHKTNEKPIEIKSPLILIDAIRNDPNNHKMTAKILPGELMRHALHQKMLAIMPRALFKYREAPAKALERYLGRHWRINQKHGRNYANLQVHTLMEVLGIDALADNRYKRKKERFERYLTAVCGEKNKKWWYNGWDESLEDKKLDEVLMKNFLGITVTIKMPEEVFSFYEEFIDETPQQKTKKKQVSDWGRRLVEAVDRLAIRHGLTQKEARELAANQIGIDEVTLYRIITGRTKRPTKNVRKQCEKWLKAVQTELASRE